MLTGYADRISINQVIADAHDASVEPDIKDAYLRQLQRHLRPVQPPRRALVVADDARQEGDGRLARPRADASSAATATRSPASAAPAKWRAMRTGWIKVMDADRACVLLAQKTAVKSGKTADLAVAIDLLTTRNASVTALDRRFNAAGVTGCQLNRQA